MRRRQHGRGALSDAALAGFCEFFLETVLDQIQFMSGLLDLPSLRTRIRNLPREGFGIRRPDGGWKRWGRRRGRSARGSWRSRVIRYGCGGRRAREPSVDCYNIRGYRHGVTTEIKVRRVGNSLGIVLPKEVLGHLKVAEGDTVTVTAASEGSVRISPHTAEVARQMEQVQDVMRRYRHTLRELAK